MKILIAGDWHSQLHEEAASRALMQLGHRVVCFPWHQYFKTSGVLGRLAIPALKFQNKYLVGPRLDRLNRDLVARVAIEAPDAVFVYRGTHVYPGTLRSLRRIHPAAILVGYNNDDPFSPVSPRWMWRHFLRGIREYDLILAYRHHNVPEFIKAGASRVEVLRSWYIPDRNKPVTLSSAEIDEYGCDVTFVGHYEDDGRVEYLREVVRSGFRFRLWGHGEQWNPVLKKIPELRSCIPVRSVWGEKYNKALAGAKIAICFLSKLNRDTYTRRCFEIPATGTLLFSEYSKDLTSLFREGMEADYFRSLEEFRRKLRGYLVEDPERRIHVAKAGLARVQRDGHDVRSRMREVTKWIDGIRHGCCMRGPVSLRSL